MLIRIEMGNYADGVPLAQVVSSQPAAVLQQDSPEFKQVSTAYEEKHPHLTVYILYNYCFTVNRMTEI